MSRSDKAEELGRLKGAYEAAQTNITQKRCQMSPDAARWPSDVEA